MQNDFYYEIEELKYGGKFDESFLIDILQVFYEEYGRSPASYELRYFNRSLSIHAFSKVFGSWNNALKEAGVPINNNYSYYDGTETCSNCGGERLGKSWQYKNDKRLCQSCYDGSKYKYGELEPKSKLGIHFVSKILVLKYFNAETNCKRNEKFDFSNILNIEDKNYRINTSKYSKSHNFWNFKFISNKSIDNYMFIAFSENHEDIEHVWMFPKNAERIINKKNISITKSNYSIEKIKEYELDSEKFNDIYHSLKLEKCSILKSD